jgi:hypothetical protein
MYVLSHVWVTVDGVWIADRIYWTLWYSAWLQLQFTITHTHTVVFTVTSSLIVARYRLLTADVPFPLGSRTIHGLSYELLTATDHNWTSSSYLTNSVTHQLNWLTLSTNYYWLFIYCYRSLPSNGPTCHSVVHIWESIVRISVSKFWQIYTGEPLPPVVWKVVWYAVCIHVCVWTDGYPFVCDWKVRRVLFIYSIEGFVGTGRYKANMNIPAPKVNRCSSYGSQYKNRYFIENNMTVFIKLLETIWLNYSAYVVSADI